MDKVNIYLQTSIKGPRRRDGIGGYILECERQQGNATLTNFVKIENEAENGAEVLVFDAALSRIKKPCALSIFTDSSFLENALKCEWWRSWRDNEWKNGKGEQISHSEEWQRIAEILNTSEVCHILLKEPHEYRKYLENETRRKEKE